MKLKWKFGMAITLFLGTLVGCSQGSSTSSSAPQEQTKEQTKDSSGQKASSQPDFSKLNVTITMGPTGGTTYPVGAVISEMISKDFPGSKSSVTVGGSISNIELINKNEAQMGHATSDLAFAAANGSIEPFDKGAKPNVLGVAKLMDQVYQFAILEESGISSLKEIKEKKYPLKLAVNPRGNISELVTRRVLEANGITYEDIKKWGGRVEYVSHSDASSLIRDGHVEAIALFTSVPASALTEIDVSRPLRVLTLSDEVMDTLSTNFGYAKMSVPAGAYKGQKEEAKTLGGGIVLLANKDLPEDVVYHVTKWICSEQGIKQLGSIHKNLSDYLTGADKAATDVGAPLHPGAEKYYREVGAIK